jgi:hypothetical protein
MTIILFPLLLRSKKMAHHCNVDFSVAVKSPWNIGKLMGQKSPLKLKEIWAIRIRLQRAGQLRDLTLLNLAIDSKLRV